MLALGAGRLKKFESSKEELDKCVLVCANCHREVHAGIKVINKGMAGKVRLELTTSELTAPRIYH